MTHKRNTSGLKPFVKGQSGNPGGMPKGIVSHAQVKAIVGRFWALNRTELQAIVDNPKSSMGEIAVAAVLVKAANDGDYSRLSFLLDRMVGKVTDVVESTTHLTTEDLTGVPRETLHDFVRKLG